MFEYVFGFLVGAVTTYICLKGQSKQFDQVIQDNNQQLREINQKLNSRY